MLTYWRGLATGEYPACSGLLSVGAADRMITTNNFISFSYMYFLAIYVYITEAEADVI